MPLPSRIDLPSLNDNEGSFTPEPVYKPSRSLPQINMTRPEKKPVKGKNQIALNFFNWENTLANDETDSTKLIQLYI